MKLYTASGGTGYRNQGPDRRIGGMVGVLLAWIQRTFSFHSETGPYRWKYYRDGLKIAVSWSRPGFIPWFELFIPHKEVIDRPRWWSVRFGYKFDARWDETPGRGGYFPDVIIKLDIDNLAE